MPENTSTQSSGGQPDWGNAVNDLYDDLNAVLAEAGEDEIISGPGSLEKLNGILPQYKDVLVFHDKTGFQPCGAAQYFKNAADRMAVRFWNIGYVGKALPIDDIEKIYAGITQNKQPDPANDLIVAVGGGTVMDLAKIFSIAYSNGCASVEEVLTDKSLENKVDTVLVPTTAGTGSEATSFAVVYKEKVKYSIDHPSLLPKYTVLDPMLLRSLPEPVLNATVLDALSQAVESTWARGSTDQSKLFSRNAIQSIMKYMEINPQPAGKTVGNIPKKTVITKQGKEVAKATAKPADKITVPPVDPLERLCGFQVGSHLAGKAINISRTTLPHSMSYPLTSHFGIPHGIAVFLSLPFVSALNYAATPASVQEGMTVEEVRQAFKTILQSFGVKTIDRYIQALRAVMKKMGIKQRLSDYGIKKEDLPFLAENSITKGRSDNNPRKVDSVSVLRILESIY